MTDDTQQYQKTREDWPSAAKINGEWQAGEEEEESQYQRDEEILLDDSYADEDVERQRTVENIWKITVSLNILYKDNWTRLAELEIQKFQHQLIKRLVMDLTLAKPEESSVDAAKGRHYLSRYHVQQRQQQQHWTQYPHSYRNSAGERERGGGKSVTGLTHRRRHRLHFEWNFATAFLYSLTVITTVGYGRITSRSTLGRLVTIAYATIGIPLTLLYLSSTGSMLARLARYFCSNANCCICLSKQRRYCGCCFGMLPALPKKGHEIKLSRLRQHKPEIFKLRAQQQQQHLAYCYVRPPALTATHSLNEDVASATASDFHLFETSFDTLSMATATTGSVTQVGHKNPFGWSLVAPIGLCLLLMVAYVLIGALVVSSFEDWSVLEGVYFCFMSLTTIGFCDLLPGVGGTSIGAIWFYAFYLLIGLTLTSVCVNILLEEIQMRMRVAAKFKKVCAKETQENRKSNYYGAPP